MLFFKLPAPVRRLILSSMPLVFALSACTTVESRLSAPTCFTEMVTASGLEAPTAHAPLPSEATAGAWVAFGNDESGQLDKANADKGAVIGIGKTCDKWATEAKKQVEHKPWWKRIF